MKLIRGLINHKQYANEFAGGCVASIGNFDGLHLGHQKLLADLAKKSNELNLPSTIISFEPLPAEFFMPTPPTRIYPLRDKVRLLNQLGVDYYMNLRFNNVLANMAAEDFVQQFLLDQLNVRYLVVGDDFRFGKQRTGDFQLLQSMGETAGMQVCDTPTCHYNKDERISSTLIRQHLAAGNIKVGNKLLGQSYQLSGRVRHGQKLGRTIGYPTLNLLLPNNIAPVHGVYAVRVKGLADTPLTGVASLGTNPTVNGQEVRLETYLFDYNDNAYGQTICVQLDKFLRPEEKFDSFEIMKQQIDRDAEIARQYYKE
ncbi:MAG TPA: bifunctional riboflavin kinase/FAD synthetase [Leucothrix mucor]|uniref:Riboflavin biosynthesis protein n=1 Tax=Leucothrix mucor TaxID=45248 RepID=A0A7V2WVI5_LEUMU|nr:bifunctional riboflavin kinase/FAD synthetase [Leucothrix mucor]